MPGSIEHTNQSQNPKSSEDRSRLLRYQLHVGRSRAATLMHCIYHSKMLYQNFLCTILWAANSIFHTRTPCGYTITSLANVIAAGARTLQGFWMLFGSVPA
jgi:hypothetical protein